MNLEDALRKIKKCLALGKDKNADPNIAAAAMRQAQALMSEHRINEGDARLSEVLTERCTARTTAHPRWENNLAVNIAQAFGCETIWTAERKFIGGRITKHAALVFVGIGAAPKIAGYAWDVLSRQCVKARLAHIRTQPGRCKPITLTARGDVFAEGWVISATHKLQRLGGSDAEQLLIENYMKATWPNSTTGEALARGNKGHNVSTNDFHRGIVAGTHAQLDRAVGASTQGLLT